MKYALLIAWREYAESLKAKGFWIGIFMMPITLFLAIQVPVWLEQKATPVRNFVLVDRSSNFAAVVGTAIERGHQRRVLEALHAYAARFSDPRATSAEAQQIATKLAEFEEGGNEGLDAFIRKGGKEFFLAELKPHLRPETPPFKEPRRLYQQVSLPPEADATADLPSLAAQLRPYLRGDKQFEWNGQPTALYVAVLIPSDLEQYIVRPRSAQGAPPSNVSGTERQPHEIQYWSTAVTAMKEGTGLAREIEQAVNAEIRRREYQVRGMDQATIRQVEQTHAPFA